MTTLALPLHVFALVGHWISGVLDNGNILPMEPGILDGHAKEKELIELIVRRKSGLVHDHIVGTSVTARLREFRQPVLNAANNGVLGRNSIVFAHRKRW